MNNYLTRLTSKNKTMLNKFKLQSNVEEFFLCCSKVCNKNCFCYSPIVIRKIETKINIVAWQNN